MIETFKKLRIYFLIIFLAILSIFSLFSPGLPPTHDGEYHVVRFYEFYKVLKSGVWYPIWAPDLNYSFGSPLFIYVYPLPNYFSSLLHLFGFSFIDAFKINLIIATINGAIGMYLYGKYKFGTWGGIISSVSYTYAPYHLLDIYIRGSVGEVWALSLFPFFLYFFDIGIQKRKIFFSLIAGVIFSLIIFSHNILAVMFLFFIIFYSLFQLFLFKNLKIITYITIPILSGILLASIFILPALLEQKYVVGLKIFNLFEHFPELYQIFIPSWGSGYSGISSGNQMSFQIGIVNLIVIILVFIGLYKRKIESSFKKYVLFFLCTFILSTFLVTTFSKEIYNLLPFMQLFQFPWRFLSIVILCTSILAGSIAIFYKSKKIYIVIILLIFATTFSYTRIPYFHQRSDRYYINSENLLYGTNSIGNSFQTKWLSQQTQMPNADAYLLSNMKNVRSLVKLPNSQTYIINITKPDTLVLNTAYFPGWEVSVNNTIGKIINRNGLISANVKAGRNEVVFTLKDTAIRKLGKMISIISAVCIFLILIKKSDTIKS